MSDASHSSRFNGELPRDSDALEAFLNARTALTDRSRNHLESLTQTDLRTEIGQLSKVMKNLASAIAWSVEDPDSLNALFAKVEPAAVSREHGWRTIFISLKLASGSDAVAHRRSALIKYMQFLSARKRFLDDLLDGKSGFETTDVLSSSEIRLALDAHMVGSSDEGAEPARSGQSEDGDNPSQEEFVRLAAGNTVSLRTRADGVLPILLAGHQFELVVGGRVYLRDATGLDYELLPGRNVVGRHPDCEVVLPGRLRNISRAHVLVERVSDDTINLTDLSSEGTYLAAELMSDQLR